MMRHAGLVGALPPSCGYVFDIHGGRSVRKRNVPKAGCRRLYLLLPAILRYRQVYESRLAALLAARNDRTDEHKRAQERYKKVSPCCLESLPLVVFNSYILATVR